MAVRMSLVRSFGFLVILFALVQARPKCESVTLTVSASANNFDMSSVDDPLALTLEELDGLPRSFIPTKSYKIAARYCEPELQNAARKNTLQLLIHGVTLTKEYWDGYPDVAGSTSIYSWVDYASQQGYPTLAFDRICNGDSDTPSGLFACQLPLNTAILSDIIRQVQNTNVVGDRRFSTVIPVGHSEGSLICEYHMQLHPDAPVGTYILTGFTNNLFGGALTSFASVGLVPAAIARPDKYLSLLLDPTYLIGTNPRGLEGIYFFGDYDRSFAALLTDLDNTTPLTLGELASALLGQVPAQEYDGSVLVLNGANDQIFCARSFTDPLTGFRGDCGSGENSQSAKTQVLFPKANYSWEQIENTGHNMNLHLTAQETFEVAHNYLASLGF